MDGQGLPDSGRQGARHRTKVGWAAALAATMATGALLVPTSAQADSGGFSPKAGKRSVSRVAKSSTPSRASVTKTATPRLGAPRTIKLPARHASTTRRGMSQMGAPTVGAGTPETNAKLGPLPLQTFDTSFTYGGTTYPVTMVGTNPAGAAVTTRIANTLTPISLSVGGYTIAPSSANITSVTGSGLFNNISLAGLTGQYGNLFMRTQFWTEINSGAKAWNVLMNAPTVTATTRLTVPSDKGGTALLSNVRTALVDVDWFDSQILGPVWDQQPSVLTQFLAGNVLLCAPYIPSDQTYSTCGIGGYHSAVFDSFGGHTYSYQSYLNSAIYGAADGFYNAGPMSHELAEWLADPYVDNVVPVWKSPLASAAGYGCMDVLESADPLVGKFIVVNSQPYADNAYLSWFARRTSTSWQKRYTHFNSFTTYAAPNPTC